MLDVLESEETNLNRPSMDKIQFREESFYLTLDI